MKRSIIGATTGKTKNHGVNYLSDGCGKKTKVYAYTNKYIVHSGT